MGTVSGERGFGGEVEIGNGDWLDLPCDRYRVVRRAESEGRSRDVVIIATDCEAKAEHAKAEDRTGWARGPPEMATDVARALC
jgi:hypothetical protein